MAVHGVYWCEKLKFGSVGNVSQTIVKNDIYRGLWGDEFWGCFSMLLLLLFAASSFNSMGMVTVAPSPEQPLIKRALNILQLHCRYLHIWQLELFFKNGMSKQDKYAFFSNDLVTFYVESSTHRYILNLDMIITRL